MKKTKKKQSLVAVINTSTELVEILEYILREAGYDTKALFTTQLKSGEINIDEFLRENHPDVILYDIAIPYEENYKFFKNISNKDDIGNIPTIITTTNKDALEKLVGKTKAHEIVGKPFDLKDILNAVKAVT